MSMAGPLLILAVPAIAVGWVNLDGSFGHFIEGALPEAVRQGHHEAIPLARYGGMDEIASAVGFLCSDAAGYVNGTIIYCDGGQVLAGAELAIVSSRRPRLRGLAAAGKRGAATALRLTEDPGRFLSSVQIGITLVSILNGAYSGERLAEPVADAVRVGLPVGGVRVPLAVQVGVVEGTEPV